jgi:AraC-like DNA-binding protein
MCFTAIFHHFAIISPNRFWTAVLAGHTIPLAFLNGPFLYFYTRNTLRDSTKLSKLDYLNFLPFIICTISLLPYYFLDFDSKLKIAALIINKPSSIFQTNFSWLYPSFLNLILRPLFLFIYSTSCLIILYRFIKKKKNLQLNKKQEEIGIKWLIIINCIILLISLGYTFLAAEFYISKSINVIKNSIFSYILSTLFSLIPLLILIFPEILYGLHKIKKNKKTKTVHHKENHESLVNTASLILDLVKNEDNLVNPNFSINDICRILELKSQEVNYCFNVILKTKFITLRREFRVELAKRELTNGQLTSNSMEGIWMKSGFSSKTSFFVAFKEVTGMTPLEYLKSIED